MATQNFTNFDKLFLKMHSDMTAVTYNLTKLFLMKLKTTTRAILWKKKRTLWLTQNVHFQQTSLIKLTHIPEVIRLEPGFYGK